MRDITTKDTVRKPFVALSPGKRTPERPCQRERSCQHGGMFSYLFLVMAIVAEVIATSALKMTHQFTRLGPSVVVIAGYAVAFYCLSHVLKTIPVGVAYAIWSGLGIVLVTVVGAFLFKQVPDLAAIIGMTLIVAGVLVINLFSKTVAH